MVSKGSTSVLAASLEITCGDGTVGVQRGFCARGICTGSILSNQYVRRLIN